MMKMMIYRCVLPVTVMAAVLALSLAGCGEDEPPEQTQAQESADDDEDWTPNLALRARSSSQIDPADMKQDDTPAPPFESSRSKTAAAIYAVRFETNRKAVFHCGDKEFALPGTIWLDEKRAPGGEPLLAFRPRVDGSYEFLYDGRVSCTLTDGGGKALIALQATETLDDEGTDEDPFVTVFKIHLVRP